jgi:hypothetical protein
MKVAVMLFGQPRFFKEITHSFIREEFNLPGHDVHFYSHFWDKIGYIPYGEEDSYDKEILYQLWVDKFSFDENFKSLKIEDYTYLDKICNHMTFFATQLHKRPLPIGKNLQQLRYKFGQHYSMNQCYKKIKQYEDKKKFKYDLIIKTRTDIVYRPEKTYETKEDYLKDKEDYYFNDISCEAESTPTIKAVALRLLDLTAKINKQSDRGYTQVLNSFYKHKFKLLKDPNAGWLDYVENYTIRLALNDWTLICNRSAADYMFDKWFENYFVTFSKDIINNNTSSSFISMSDHSLQGQMLLNYPILAKRIYDRRDVRLLHPTFIKEETDHAGKLFSTCPKALEGDLYKYKKWKNLK